MHIDASERQLIGFLKLFIFGSGFVIVCASVGLLIAARKLSTGVAPPRGYIGSPVRGSALVDHYGCTSCHSIPGHAPAGMTGPTLDHMSTRSYIAGRFANERIDMESWIAHPQAMKPGSAMPELSVTERDARDIAAYLATLR